MSNSEAAARAANLMAQAQSTVESNFALVGGSEVGGGIAFARRPLPAGTAKRSLDADIAGEGGKVVDGMKVILSDGSQVVYQRPPEKLNIPDMSTIDAIKHYFGPRGYQPYPTWLYHPTKDAILVKDAKEAAELGIVYRKTTADESARFGRNETWDWEEGCEWRPTPFRAPAINFADHAGSKNLITGAPDPTRVQADLVASVAAAVAQVLKVTPGTAAPAGVDARDWDEFKAFQTWKKAQEVVGAAVVAEQAAEAEAVPEGAGEVSINALSPEQDRILWEAEAERLGIKINKSWTLETLKQKVEAKLNPSAAAG